MVGHIEAMFMPFYDHIHWENRVPTLIFEFYVEFTGQISKMVVLPCFTTQNDAVCCTTMEVIYAESWRFQNMRNEEVQT